MSLEIRTIREHSTNLAALVLTEPIDADAVGYARKAGSDIVERELLFTTPD